MPESIVDIHGADGPGLRLRSARVEERHHLAYSGRRILLLILLVCAAAEAQAQRPVHVAAVDSGLVRSDARLVLVGAAPRIELALLGQSHQYSRAQARPRLKQFFRQFPPQRFTWTTEEVTGAHWFATGRYHVHPTGMALRLYAHWQKQGEGWELVTIHVFR